MSYSIFNRVLFQHTKNLIPHTIRGISSTSKSHQVQALDTIDRHDDLKQRIKVLINFNIGLSNPYFGA